MEARKILIFKEAHFSKVKLVFSEELMKYKILKLNVKLCLAVAAMLDNVWKTEHNL